jgi:hypothetical protein
MRAFRVGRTIHLDKLDKQHAKTRNGMGRALNRDEQKCILMETKNSNFKLAGVDDSTLVIKQVQNNLEDGEIIEETENLTGKASNKARKFNCNVLTLSIYSKMIVI